MTRIMQFFATPVFEDEEEQRAASLLNIILNVILGSVVVLVLALTLVSPGGFWGDTNTTFIAAGMVISMLAMRFLLRHGNIRLTSTLLSSALWVGTSASIYFYSGIRNASTSGYLVCIILASLLLGGRAALVVTAISVAAVAGMWYGETSGRLVYQMTDLPGDFDVIALSGIFIMGGLLLRYAADSILRSLERARRNEQAQAASNRELQKLQASLEHQVAERTRDLQRRTNYLEATAQVSRAASSTLKVDELTQQVVELIRERFGMLYVGLFLVDDVRGAPGKWAMLQAGTGQAGQTLRARGHVLPVGPETIVGWSIANGKSRVATERQDGQASVQLATDELPQTRSETALPLHSRGRVIGALDVHSDQLDAFDQAALAALQSMADQVAVALDNARLFAQSQAALEAERRAYGQMGREVWSQLLRAGATPGYGFAGDQVVPLGDEWTPEMDAALHADKSVIGLGHNAAQQPQPALAVPIKVRGQTIGIVDLRKQDARSTWTAEEVRLIETLTEQLGVALEGARLYQDTQRRAAREQAINIVTANVRSEATVNAILQRTAQELGRSFGAARTTIELNVSGVEREANADDGNLR